MNSLKIYCLIIFLLDGTIDQHLIYGNFNQHWIYAYIVDRWFIFFKILFWNEIIDQHWICADL